MVVGGGIETARGEHAGETTKGGIETSGAGGGGGNDGQGKEGQEGEKGRGERGRGWRCGPDGQGARGHAEGGTRENQEEALIWLSCISFGFALRLLGCREFQDLQGMCAKARSSFAAAATAAD